MVEIVFIYFFSNGSLVVWFHLIYLNIFFIVHFVDSLILIVFIIYHLIATTRSETIQ